MGKIRGLPGTPHSTEVEKDTQESEEDMAQKATDKGFSNSHANLMNEGEDDDWKASSDRYSIERNRRDDDGDEY